jgi:transporter family-2 protein
VNARLGKVSLYATLATVISFSTGLAILTLLVLFEHLISRARGSPKNCLRWSERPHLSLLLPGTLGVVFVSATVFLTPIVGISLFWICIVCGQLFAAVIADARGWAVAKPLPVSRARFLALSVCLAGVALTISEEVAAPTASVGAVIGSCVAAVFVGAVTIAQSLLNRFAAAILPSRLQATWWSFFLGLPTALLVFAVQFALMPQLSEVTSGRLLAAPPYIYSGGALGVIYVFASIYVPTYIGSQAFAIAQLTGQLAGAAIIDSLGLLETPTRAISILRACGLTLVVIAAAALKFS